MKTVITFGLYILVFNKFRILNTIMLHIKLIYTFWFGVKFMNTIAVGVERKPTRRQY